MEDDRRTITVPVIGGLRSKENTRRVQRHLTAGRAQILNMTLSQRWGRLFVSVCYALAHAGHRINGDLSDGACRNGPGSSDPGHRRHDRHRHW